MSEGAEALLVDAGNTNIKYCLVDANHKMNLLHAKEISSKTDLLNLNIKQVLLCSVREVEFARELKRQSLSADLEFKQIFTQPCSFGTRCAYQNYQTLGVDRWMNILAVAKESDEAILTFSIGTAMTVDLIYKKQHIGGWITPGFDMSKNALFENTSGVFGDSTYPYSDGFGESTVDCVNYGCRALVNGLLREALNLAQKYSSNVKIKAFGGGIKLVNTKEFTNIEVDDLLVFKGMLRFL